MDKMPILMYNNGREKDNKMEATK